MHINDIPTDAGAIPAMDPPLAPEGPHGKLCRKVAMCRDCKRSQYGICVRHRIDRLFVRDLQDRRCLRLLTEMRMRLR